MVCAEKMQRYIVQLCPFLFAHPAVIHLGCLSTECVSLSSLVATFLVPRQVQVPASPGKDPNHLKIRWGHRFPLEKYLFLCISVATHGVWLFATQTKRQSDERLGQNRELLPCILHFTARREIFSRFTIVILWYYSSIFGLFMVSVWKIPWRNLE